MYHDVCPGKAIRGLIALALLAPTAVLQAKDPILNDSVANPGRPNIVILLTDDQGYADISLNPHHGPEVSTPNMDQLAAEGIFFSQAYTSGYICSPTRAGLMLGRYQQRVGVYTGGQGGSGFDPAIPIFPAMLPDAYTSMAIGKWHLGLDEDYPELKWHPLNRGFDESYNFMGRGAHDYNELADPDDPMYRNLQRILDEGYLTDRLAEEAVGFIDRNADKPFFLYVAFNAVHTPMQAPKESIDRVKAAFPELDETRTILMAMLGHLDDAVGDIVGKLKEENVWNNTLVIFLTDNGGANATHADNAPLRGSKHTNFEGGIRVPFILTWPDRYKGGRVIKTPIISLDILPTTLDVLGVPLEKYGPFDGKSLIPVIEGSVDTHHENLFWSAEDNKEDWAVRSGNWKLVTKGKTSELFNLAEDLSEANDLSSKMPEKREQLEALYRSWLQEMKKSYAENPNRYAKQK